LRDIKVFFSDIFRKPPILFPLVAIFHVVCLVVSLISLIQQPGSATGLEVAWMLGYTLFWVGVADLRKWGALGYIGTTVVSIVVWYMAYAHGHRALDGSPIFIIDILFCFFIMFYFKRFR
jgi:hypothetical protein